MSGHFSRSGCPIEVHLHLDIRLKYSIATWWWYLPVQSLWAQPALVDTICGATSYTNHFAVLDSYIHATSIAMVRKFY